MAMTAPAPRAGPAVDRPAVPARPRRPPGLLFGLAAGVAVLLAVPLVFLLVQAAESGWAALRPLLFRQLTAQLLWNTVRLTVVVTLLCAVVGTLAAWVVERTDLPGRRLFAVLLVLPLAVPDFVESFGWVSVAPSLRGYFGAVLVMTLAVYPLVFLPVAAALRHADPAQEEVARSLGLGRFRTFWRVTLGQARRAILGGSLLVALVLLAEYGAFEILGYRTFTTEIYTEYLNGFDPPAASALSLVLVALSLCLLFGEGASRGGGRLDRTGPLAARPASRHRLGRATPAALAAVGALVALALGVPVGAIVYWLFHGQGVAVGSSSLASAAWHTLAYSASAGVLATVLALPVALLSVRHGGRLARLLERSTYLVLGIPGILIALGLVYFSQRYLFGVLYQSSPLLVIAYAVMFFPLALVAVRTSVAQAPIRLEEAARSLGTARRSVLLRVTLPLVAPGLAAAFSLVFLEAATELTATLVLHPTGVETLATQFWAFQTNLSYGQAAPYAALIVLVAALPSAVLGRWFDRLPARRPAPLERSAAAA
ncbi:MAG TPA: iron ABC transporter permease [Acidimicrobiales bacterium]|nr:iron ABC transporter permease [Acidimicrobiales bacterium]